MKRLHSSCINIALLILVLIAFYIILAIAFFPSIRIPSCLPEGKTLALNDILLKLSLTYVSACIFYYFTVVLKDKIRRGQQKWTVHDSLNMIYYSICSLLSDLRIDKKSDRESTIKELTSLSQNELDTLKDNLNGIRELIRKELLSGIIWLDYEIDCLTELDNCCGILLQVGDFSSLDNKTQELAADAVLNLNTSSNKLTRLANKTINVDTDKQPYSH